MKSRKYFLFGSLLLILPIMLSERNRPVAETLPPPEKVEVKVNPHIVTMLDDYDAHMEDLLEMTGTPGAAVAVVKDGDILYTNGFGIKQVGTKDSVDANTVFRLGSVSKTFASILTGILAEQGKVDWDDEIVDYLPDFTLKPDSQSLKIKLKHVLSHTTGLPYHAYTNLIEDGVALDTMIKKLGSLDLIGDAGQIYSYQNVAYSIIDPVLRVATNLTYDSLLQQHIFDPLGMENASASYKAMINNPNVAQPHRMRHGWKHMPISDKYYNTIPAGGINASANDMAKWLKGLISESDALLEEKSINDVFEPVVTISKYKYRRNWPTLKKAHYALGWRVLELEDDTIIYHGGYVNGYRAEIAISKKHNLGICVLANAPSGFAGRSVPALYNLYTHHLDSIQSWENQQNPIFSATATDIEEE
ncbi:MAG: serine hydrolase domain-containing protein [Bacteroidota bacterium]